MYLSKTETIVVNLVIMAYAAFGLFTEYGTNHGGWIIGSMIVLVYATIALCFTIDAVSTYIRKV